MCVCEKERESWLFIPSCTTLAHVGYAVTICPLLWWNGRGSFHSAAPWVGLVCLQHGWTAWQKMSLNWKVLPWLEKGHSLWSIYLPLRPCSSPVIHLLSSIGTQQFSVQSCLARNITRPLCPHVFEFLYSWASPCSFSKEIIIRMGPLSRIPADALHQSYSAHCHIGKLLSKGKNSRILLLFFFFFNPWNQHSACCALHGTAVPH